MSVLIPCSLCGSREPGALTQTTWAWYLADQTRVAYRQRLCVTCMASTVIPLHVASEAGTLTCPACGSSSIDDLDGMYCTFFPRGVGRMSMELATDASCAAQLRIRAQQGAVKLENREPQFGGQDTGHQTTSSVDWAALGLRPRE